MTHFNVPRADLAIFVFLVCVTGVAGSVGALLYWLMLPTVIPNAVFVEVKPRAMPFVRQLKEAAIVSDMERAAVDGAMAQNAELGIKTPAALAALAGAAHAEALPEQKVEPKQAQKQQQRPKRVAQQVPRRAPPEPWQRWGFAQRAFGGFWFQ
jgi:hypothetical protein